MYQQPTLSGVHVRSIRDALHIFYAVARHVLPIISRRLDPDERKSIAPGNVYVWEERSANSDAAGLTMERWYIHTPSLSLSLSLVMSSSVSSPPLRTDGMTWGPSRVRDVRAVERLV
jgi:Gti1/Pac2 family transcription factor